MNFLKFLHLFFNFLQIIITLLTNYKNWLTSARSRADVWEARRRFFGVAAMGRSEAGRRAARPEKAARRAPRATARRRLDGGTASVEEGARSAGDGGGGCVRRGGGCDRGHLRMR